MARSDALTTLQDATRLLRDDSLATTDLLGRIALLLPAAFQFPEIAAARVRYGSASCTTEGYRESPWVLASPFATTDAIDGALEVRYLERPATAGEPFLADEQHLLDVLAGMLCATLERRDSEHRLRRSEDGLTAALEAETEHRARAQLLLDLTNAITSTLDFATLLERISVLLRQTLPHHFTTMTVWDAETDRLRRVALISKTDREEPYREVVPHGWPADIVFRTRAPLVVRWPDPLKYGAEFVRESDEQLLRSGCGVPLLTARGCVGTLMFGADVDRDYPPEEITLLEQIARQLAIAVENALAYHEISALKDRLTEEKLYLEEELTERTAFTGIIGHSRALAAVLHQVRTVAPTDATVLLLGETGTGKEILARAIHAASRRSQHTFVFVNAAALPATLVESELFGFERGAFTGAVATKVGRIELAHGGTLFLDEIGDMPLELQPKLLRTLEQHEFERLGGIRTRKVDVRLIAATNRDLEAMIAANTFRADLYYRLSVFPIEVPPLRARPEDIPALVRFFVAKFAREIGRTITSIPAVTMERLRAAPWPGNIRELQNVIERAVILSPGPELQVPASVFQKRPQKTVATPPASAPAETRTYQDSERDIIVQALRDARGVIGGANGAAARLGIKRTTLNSKMRKLGIVRPSF